MSKRKKYKIPIWKHNPKSSDNRFIQMYHDQLLNDVFLSLSPTSVKTYIYMLDYSVGKMEFEFPYSVYKKITTKATFQKCIKELSEKGFIEIIGYGKNTRTPNVYKFTSNWYINNN